MSVNSIMTGNPAATGSLDRRYLTRHSYSPSQAFIDERISPQPSSSRSLECQKVMDRISTFCSSNNLMQRVAYLQQELAIYGYPEIKVTSDPDKPGDNEACSIELVDLINLVNITYDLLRLWRQTLEARNDASDLQRSSDAEISRLKHVSSRLREEVASKDRDLKSRDLSQYQLSQRIEDLKKKMKSEQEKSRRLTSEMTSRDIQFKHEKKKKMQEMEKLQGRLQQLLQDKRQERMLGIEILNSLQRKDGKRGKWNTDQAKKNNEQDMYRLIINNYEDSQRQLLKENEGMRQYLKEMQDELIAALNERNSLDQSGRSPEKSLNLDDQPSSVQSSGSASPKSEASEEPMSDGMFEMPYDLVKDDIEKSIRAKWKMLKREMRRSRQSKSIQSERLKASDREYSDLVREQQNLIEYLTSGKDENGERPVPEDSYFLEEKAELEEEQKKFLAQKQAFDKERQLYAEAALQLDDQRQAFEFEKSQWYQKSFLQLTPFKNDGRPNTSPLQKYGVKSSTQQDKAAKRRHHSKSSTTPNGAAKFQNTSDYKSARSPHNLSQSWSHLQTSNAFLTESARRFAWQQSKATPEGVKNGHPPNTKSTTKKSVMPPSTAELYRTLGLVYRGSDKENEDSVDAADESSSQVCPRSSGKASRHAVPPVVIGSNKSLNSTQRDEHRRCISNLQSSNPSKDPLPHSHMTKVRFPISPESPNSRHGDFRLLSHAKNLQLAHLKKKWSSITELNSNPHHQVSNADIFETRPRCHSTPSRGKHSHKKSENLNDLASSSPEFVSASGSMEDLSDKPLNNSTGSLVQDNIADQQQDKENVQLRKSHAHEKLFFGDDLSDVAVNDLLQSSRTQDTNEKSGWKKFGIKGLMKRLLSPKWNESSKSTLTTHYSIISDSPQPSGSSQFQHSKPDPYPKIYNANFNPISCESSAPYRDRICDVVAENFKFDSRTANQSGVHGKQSEQLTPWQESFSNFFTLLRGNLNGSEQNLLLNSSDSSTSYHESASNRFPNPFCNPTFADSHQSLHDPKIDGISTQDCHFQRDFASNGFLPKPNNEGALNLTTDLDTACESFQFLEMNDEEAPDDCHQPSSDLAGNTALPVSKSATGLLRPFFANNQNLSLSNSLPSLVLDSQRRARTLSENPRKKSRSMSFEGATLPAATERHKTALLSFSAKLRPGDCILRDDSLDISIDGEERVFGHTGDPALFRPGEYGNMNLESENNGHFYNGLAKNASQPDQM